MEESRCGGSGALEPIKIIGRVTHENYLTESGFCSKSKFVVLKRKSTGSLDDVFVDPWLDIENIDLGKYPAGVYELVSVGSIDYETGVCDDIEFHLKLVSE